MAGIATMMSWMAERDRLLAQTRAFVKEVAAAHPRPARDILPDALPPGPPRGDAGVVPFSPVSVAPTRAKIIEAAKVAETPSSPLPSAPARPVVPETKISEAGVSTVWASIGGSGESDRGVETARSEVKAPLPDTILIIPRVATSERDDIAIRVAHFREHQRRLNREREAHSEQMRAHIRTVLGSGGSAA